MLRQEIQRLTNTTPRELRKFGLVVGGVFLLLALIFATKRHEHWYWWVLVPGLLLVVPGAILPRSLKWVYMGWMAMALILGAIVSTVLLTLLFFLVVTPLALVARLAGKDFLSLKLNLRAPSYWIPRTRLMPKQKREHERQF